MKTCQGCGDPFAPNYPEQKYHSHGCFLSAMNRDQSRQSAKGKRGGDVRGKQLQEQAVPNRSYAKVPGTDLHEHRVVAERVLGRPLQPGEVVHHEDENKRNNDPANLIVFVNQAEHARHHKLGHCLAPSCDCDGIRLKEVMPA